MKKIATPSATLEIMNKHGISAKKSLGQNFIIEPHIIERIAAAADCDKQDLVLEIGPGLGSLTQALGEAAGQVVSIEIDRTLIDPLRETFADSDNIEIVHADALTADIPALLTPWQQTGNFRPGFMAVANLPYYITTPIIMRFLEGLPENNPENTQQNIGWRRMVFMVQKEMADRMQATPGSKDYGALSLAVQYRAKASIAFIVPPSVFIPRPKVASAVIVLDRLDTPPAKVRDEKMLFAVIRAGFGQRRKTLLNSLTSGLALQGCNDTNKFPDKFSDKFSKEQIAAALTAAGIAPNRRAETLTITEFAALADAISDITDTPDI